MIGHNSMAQSVFRAHGERGYTKLRNEFLQDQRISDETRGLVARLLSRPIDWHFTVKEIINSGPSGRDKVYRMIKEAEQFGYIIPDTPRRENGTYRAHAYVVTDDPQVLIQRTAEEILDIQNATSGFSVNGYEEANKTPLPEKPEVEISSKPLPAHPDTAKAEMDQNWKPLPAQPLPAQPDTAFQDAYKEKKETKERNNKYRAHEGARTRDGLPEKPELSRDGYPIDFEEWWALYPRKEGKGAAAAVWRKITKGQRARAMVGLRLQLGKLTNAARDQRGNFCPHPRTWLAGSRYDDVPQTNGAAATPVVSSIPDRDPDCPEGVWQAILRDYLAKGKCSQEEAVLRGLRL
jgi:hypothetical protein